MNVGLSIVGLLISGIGAVLLAKPLIKSKEEIGRISTYIDSGVIWDRGEEERVNEDLKKSLERDNVIGIIGIVLLFVGFVLQILGFKLA